MEFRESYIKGLFEITPKIFSDERGFFLETYSDKAFKDNGLNLNFVQDNQSFSTKGVLRGLHFQKPPFAQGKLVRVITGKVLDVAVDLRKDSPTFGKYDSVILDPKKCNMFYIPEGFAHGFAALEDSLFLYKSSNIYNRNFESGIRWDDPDLNIQWPFRDPVLSDKDQRLDSFQELLRKSVISPV